MNETDSLGSNSQSDISAASSEPVKERERERFRDKVKNKLRIRVSSAKDKDHNNGPKENELPHIDTNFSKVEIDFETSVPKIVAICCKILEHEVNIKTSGLYRVSGS